MSNLTFIEDQFIIDTLESHTRWIAVFDDFQIISDDDRYAEHNPTFLRMKKFCIDNNYFPKSIIIKFRSHIEKVWEDTDDCNGLFFSNAIIGQLQSNKNMYSYLFGTVINDEIFIDKWRIPEIIKTDSEIRLVNNDNYENILWKKKKNQLHNKLPK